MYVVQADDQEWDIIRNVIVESGLKAIQVESESEK
jgi:hypothetical protein